MLRLSSVMALGFGGFLAIAEAWRNWGDWQWWPFWLVDYIAAGLLISGAVIFLRRGHKAWLTGGWGFTAAMFWMSFFTHVANQIELADRQYGPGGVMAEDQMTMIIGGMTLISFAGFILALVGKPGITDKNDI